MSSTYEDQLSSSNSAVDSYASYKFQLTHDEAVLGIRYFTADDQQPRDEVAGAIESQQRKDREESRPILRIVGDGIVIVSPTAPLDAEPFGRDDMEAGLLKDID